MCFFICGNNNSSITVIRATERIDFSWIGRTKIVADILIRADDKTSDITSLHILYPNSFFKKNSSEFKLHNSTFENSSARLLEEYEENSVYRTLGYRKTYRGYLDKEKTIKKVEITIPQERLHGAATPLSGGLFALENDLEPFPNTKDLKIKRLLQEELHYTPFELQLSSPLKDGQQCWLTLEFKPLKTTLFKRTYFSSFKYFMINSLTHNYQIIGPVNVYERFIERLETNILASQDLGDEKTAKLYLQIKDIYKKMFCPDKVTYKSWQIHLLAYKVGALYNFLPDKNIIPQGTLPSFSLDKSKKFKKYTWSYDWESNWMSKGSISADNGKLCLWFFAKIKNHLYQYAPYLLFFTILFLHKFGIKKTLTLVSFMVTIGGIFAFFDYCVRGIKFLIKHVSS